ncbi:MAG: MlaD family protein [Fuerstiella sp.]
MNDKQPATNSEPNTVPAATVSSEPVTDFPQAEVREAGAGALLRQSRLWWVTLGCLLLALGLAWQSMPQTGPRITIRFPEGHGLKEGDAVRYRGIDVGRVTSVGLDEQLSGVEVHVTLTPGGAALSRDGTRFWIVRPRLSLSEISGLDTAVGAKYIGVSPGDPAGARRKTFDGLAVAPPDELADGGLDLILQAEQLHGVSTGAPVVWRGVDVGKVLSVGLSADARHVHIGIRIDGPYRRLVNPNSRFWVTSGFGVDVGLTGFKLNAQSLTTIARGGISFISPAPEDGAEVRSGKVFELFDKADPDWLDAASTVPLIGFPVPETVTVRARRKTHMLGIPRSKEFTQTGILLSGANGVRLLTAELPTVVSEADVWVIDDFEIEPVGAEPVRITAVDPEICESPGSGVWAIPVGSAQVLAEHAGPAMFRRPESPELCLLVRSASADGKVVPVVQPLDPGQMSPQDGGWRVSDSSLDLAEWHGAPVVAAVDGRIVGLLIIGPQGPLVALTEK